MKTKIVYAVVGAVDNTYLEQAVVSAYSTRLHNPQAYIEIVVDDETNVIIENGRRLILSYINEKIVATPPSNLTKVQKSRWIKTKLRELVSGDFLYIDTDTIIADSLESVDDITDSVAAVRDLHIYFKESVVFKILKSQMKKVHFDLKDEDEQFNGGVLYCKDDEKGHELFRNWHELWLEYLKNYDISIDQPALVVANSKSGHPIKHLPDIFNCQVCKNGLKYLYHAKIVHYFASNTGLKAAPCSYLFQNDQIFEEIMKLGYISVNTKALIQDCKSAFPLETFILSDKMYDLYFRDSLIPSLIYNYGNRPALFMLFRSIINSILACGRLIKR